MSLRGKPLRTTLTVRVNPTGRGGPVAPAVHGEWDLHRTNPRTVLLLVHGFNNSPDDAREGYKAFSDQVLRALSESREEPEAIVGFHWPGNLAVSPFGYLDAVGYPLDVHQAIEAAERLAEYMTDQATPRFRWVIVGHSLGCRLILEALSRMPRAPVSPEIELTVLMAAAVPVSLAAVGKPLSVAQMPEGRILKFHSTDDWVLWLTFPVGQSLAFDGGGVMPVAIGRHGDPASLGQRVRTTNGHGQYWRDKGVANAVANFYDPTLPKGWQVYALPRPVEFEARQLQERHLSSRALPE